LQSKRVVGSLRNFENPLEHLPTVKKHIKQLLEICKNGEAQFQGHSKADRMALEPAQVIICLIRVYGRSVKGRSSTPCVFQTADLSILSIIIIIAEENLEAAAGAGTIGAVVDTLTLLNGGGAKAVEQPQSRYACTYNQSK